MRKGIAILAVLLCPPASTWCQELQRRSFIGLELVGQGPRLIVRHVETGSTAENAGVVVGDTLLAIGGIAISDANQLTLASRTYRAGTSIRFSIERKRTTPSEDICWRAFTL
jgi:predicted metalloprotease with PDZ domain